MKQEDHIYEYFRRWVKESVFVTLMSILILSPLYPLIHPFDTWENYPSIEWVALEFDWEEENNKEENAKSFVYRSEKGVEDIFNTRIPFKALSHAVRNPVQTETPPPESC